MWPGYRLRDTADERAHIAATDGWTIVLHRWRAVDPTRNFPVLLVPGLAASRFTFDLSPSRSLAQYFARAGFDTWCLELRGHGMSERAGLGRRRAYDWSFDDYLERDLAAALNFLCATTGVDSVHYLGHSMGGVLLFAHLALGAARIRCGITLGSSLEYRESGSGFEHVLGLRGIERYVPAFPFGAMGLIAPLAGRIRNPLDDFNAEMSNVDSDLYRSLAANTWSTISTNVLAQLATTFEPDGLRSRSGLVYQSRLRDVHTPVLSIAGAGDRQCSPIAAQRTIDAFPADTASIEIFGRAYGHSADYGHFDLLIGKRADEEVWPRLRAWLERHD